MDPIKVARAFVSFTLSNKIYVYTIKHTLMCLIKVNEDLGHDCEFVVLFFDSRRELLHSRLLLLLDHI